VVRNRADMSIHSRNRCGRVDWRAGWLLTDSKGIAPPIIVESGWKHFIAGPPSRNRAQKGSGVAPAEVERLLTGTFTSTIDLLSQPSLVLLPIAVNDPASLLVG
jgi:hypothetical protein